jgi:hypothetical protein
MLHNLDRNCHYKVVVSGGLGNQIISLIVYKGLMMAGFEASLDLSYFSFSEKRAFQGAVGEVSRWPWQLQRLGVSLSDFEQQISPQELPTVSVPDGLLKVSLLRETYRLPGVSDFLDLDFNLFNLEEKPLIDYAEDAIVIHVRRGDYCNVASYVLPLEHSLSLAMCCSNLAKKVCLITDDESDSVERGARLLKNQFDEVIVLDHIEADLAFYMMVNSRVLCMANSQFSFAAGLLRTNLSIGPKQWYASSDPALLELDLELSRFGQTVAL